MLNQETSVDRIFRVLADPSRRAIIDHLSRGRASVSDLAKPLDISLAAVVQHVQALEECGVVHTEKVGRVRLCSLDPQALGEAQQWLANRRASWERNFDRLGALLARPTDTPDPGKESS